jgi:UPF0755 protein
VDHNRSRIQREEAPAPWLRRGIWLLFILLALSIGYILYLLGPTGTTAIVRITPGETAFQVGTELQRVGLVRSGKLFAIYLRASRLDRKLRPGVYQLTGNGSRALARALTGGVEPLRIQVTFPEGWQARQMAARLSQVGLDGAGFLELALHPPPNLKPPYDTGPNLEGFLFPATYRFSLIASPQTIIEAMLHRFAQELTPKVVDELKQSHLSIEAWVILASLVQDEAANTQQMPYIAGVFLNRLARGQPLQSDPTVAYALGKPLDQLSWKAGDYQVRSPYNTYLHPGLPPGAIDNPGQAALFAVLHPIRHDPKGKPYLYFFNGTQGRLFLSTTYQGQLRKLRAQGIPIH